MCTWLLVTAAVCTRCCVRDSSCPRFGWLPRPVRVRAPGRTRPLSPAQHCIALRMHGSLARTLPPSGLGCQVLSFRRTMFRQLRFRRIDETRFRQTRFRQLTKPGLVPVSSVSVCSDERLPLPANTGGAAGSPSSSSRPVPSLLSPLKCSSTWLDRETDHSPSLSPSKAYPDSYSP